MKAYQGNPENEPPWEAGSVIGDGEGGAWIICSKPSNHPKWTTIKLACAGQASRKANYWMGWDGERVSESRDMRMMREYRPELARQLEAALYEKSHGQTG